MNHRLTIASLVATVVLLSFFLSGLFKNEPSLQNPLINQEIEKKIPKNATIVNNVPTVSGVLKNNIKKGVYILQGTITIPENTTVEIEPQTIFYANRDAKIVVLGTLNASKVEWLSNQASQDRRYWHGLIAEQKGKITLSNCKIQDATTAITSLQGGQIQITGELKNNIVGIASLKNGKISARDVRITDGTVGIQLVGGSAEIEDAIFEKLTDGLRIFHGSNLTMNQSSFSKINRYAVRREDQGNLLLKNIQSTTPLSIYDSREKPIYTKEGKEYKNGKIIFISSATNISEDGERLVNR